MMDIHALIEVSIFLLHLFIEMVRRWLMVKWAQVSRWRHIITIIQQGYILYSLRSYRYRNSRGQTTE